MYEIVFNKKNGANPARLMLSEKVGYYYDLDTDRESNRNWSSPSYAEAFQMARTLSVEGVTRKDDKTTRSFRKARLAQKHLTGYHEEAIIQIVHAGAVVGSMVFTPNPPTA